MEIVLKKEDVKLLTNAEKVNIPFSMKIKNKKCYVKSYTSELYYEAELDNIVEDDSFEAEIIVGKDLLAILKVCPSDIYLSIDEDKINITSATFKTIVPTCKEKIGEASIERSDKVIQINNLDLINSISYCCSNNDPRVVLQGIYFEFKNNKLNCCALDGYRLSAIEIPYTVTANGVIEDTNYILEKSLVSKAIQIIGSTSAYAFLGEKHLYLTNGSKIVVGISKMNYQYPDYRKLIEQYKMECYAKVNREMLLDSVNRCSIGMEKEAIKLSISPDSKTLKVSTLDGSKIFKEEIISDVEVNGVENIIAISPIYLKEALSTSSAEYIKILYTVGEKKPIFILDWSDNENIDKNSGEIVLTIKDFKDRVNLILPVQIKK